MLGICPTFKREGKGRTEFKVLDNSQEWIALDLDYDSGNVDLIVGRGDACIRRRTKDSTSEDLILIWLTIRSVINLMTSVDSLLSHPHQPRWRPWGWTEHESRNRFRQWVWVLSLFSMDLLFEKLILSGHHWDHLPDRMWEQVWMNLFQSLALFPPSHGEP